MFKLWIYGFSLCVLVSTTTSKSSEDVEVRLLDNQNAPLVVTLDMSKADERIKQFVSDAFEANIKYKISIAQCQINDIIEKKNFSNKYIRM